MREGRDKVKELVEDAVKKGAKVLTGGTAPDGKGYFYPATVLTDVPDGADMLQRRDLRPGGRDPDLPLRGRGDPARQ